MLQMLKKDVVDNSKSCAEYFEFFKNYATSVSVLYFCGDNYELHTHVPINTDMVHPCFTAIRLQTFDS